VFAALAVAALAYYLYNTAVRMRIFGGRDAQAQNRDQAGNANPSGQAGDQQDIPWYARDNVGVAGEVARFIIPFCMSLFPGWTFPDNIPDRSVPRREPEAPEQENQGQ
jgi:hypothetical protein